ncbi:AEC family transporter [Caldalkalibacillus salinus]|uniref:AEC family transporter n=1 Tax=Caldalkalibacillus salinus TaxID=2803787 RepID=UPI0019205201|nr:AEC family transporter [Caldalkalibacillus salinus]
MDIFIQVVLPVILIFLTGYSVQKWKNIDIKSISTVAIYILTPCLVFRTFYQTELNFEYVQIIIFSLILLFSIILINKIYASIRRFSQSIESGLVLSTAFMNSGNYGAPIVLFAFGEQGFAYSVLFLVLQAIIMNFFGVYYAARGQAGIKMALVSVMKMPATYAVIIALILQWTGLAMPDNLFMAVDLVAEATIPVVMLILGMQLAEIKLQKLNFEHISFGVIVRMVISPLIAFAILQYMTLDPLLAKVLLVSAAMPSAATTVMYAVQFESEPDLVSTVTLVTTIVSVATITVLLMLLG